jgi:hypothetical protein
MKRLIMIAILGVLAWQGYTKYGSSRDAPARSQELTETEESRSGRSRHAEVAIASRFKCDGRTYCSQMTSCAEATFFLKNCPGVKMDGNNDGIPCERQWCK